eukprot:UN25140
MIFTRSYVNISRPRIEEKRAQRTRECPVKIYVYEIESYSPIWWLDAGMNYSINNESDPFRYRTQHQWSVGNVLMDKLVNYSDCLVSSVHTK